MQRLPRVLAPLLTAAKGGGITDRLLRAPEVTSVTTEAGVRDISKSLIASWFPPASQVEHQLGEQARAIWAFCERMADPQDLT